MNVKAVSDLIGISPASLRRWTGEYAEFLSPGATPPLGDDRRLNEHDIRVLHYIGASREAGMAHDKIKQQLIDWQRDGWTELPHIPDEWTSPPQDGRIAVSEAREESSALATVAAQQVVIQTLREQLETASDRAEKLQQDLDHLQATQRATESEVNALRVDLERARGEVAALQARLSAYTLTGERPIPLALIILVTALAAVVIVLIVFVVARVLL